MGDNINPDHYKRLPAEAIEIIESAIDKAPSNQDAYLHGQVLKYVLRCWNKNGIEDLKKAKWYLDRLIDSFDESEAEQLATVEVAVEVAGEVKPPDGWRWLEVDEKIRNGDKFLYDGQWRHYHLSVGEKVLDTKRPSIRRNRFEVGEKVVYIQDESVWDYISEINDGPNYPKSAHVASGSTSLRVCVTRLDPYIEETT